MRQHLGRYAEPPDGEVEHRLPGRRLHDAVDQGRGTERAGEQSEGPGVPPVHRRRERRCAGGLAERVDHVDDRLRVGVDQVERLAIAVGQVSEVVHRLRDVVDRHHVGVAEVDADHGEPARQVVPHPLQQREQVVGAVHLVHRAGLGVADHDRGPIDPPGHRRLGADDLLGLVLRPVVRRGQVLPLVEHRLVEGAFVVTGRGHRRHLVEEPHLERVGELEGVPGAADVQLLVGLVIGGHVVDRREVEEVVDAAAVLADPFVVHAEPVRRQVPDHRDHPVGAPGLDERLHPVDRRRAAEHEDRAVAVVDELLDEVPADEPRRAGHEVRHGRRLPVSSGGEEVALSGPSRNPKVVPNATPACRRT